EVVVSGDSLVAPSYDRFGWLWTAHTVNDGRLSVVDPAARATSLEVAWLGGREVQALKVSRDGSRIAVLSTVGGVQALDLAGVVRDSDGVPISVSAPLQVGADVASARALTWVDELTVAVLGSSEPGQTPSLYLVQVGGRTTVVTAVTDAVDVSARYGDRSMVLSTRDGAVHVRTTAGWTSDEATVSAAAGDIGGI